MHIFEKNYWKCFGSIMFFCLSLTLILVIVFTFLLIITSEISEMKEVILAIITVIPSFSLIVAIILPMISDYKCVKDLIKKNNKIAIHINPFYIFIYSPLKTIIRAIK